MNKLKYETREDSLLLTWCPFIRNMKIGSLFCQKCENFESMTDDEVNCKKETK